MSARDGLDRVTLGRSSSGRCRSCGQTFPTIGAAVAHGRGADHIVEGEYHARYLYLPSTDDEQ